MIDTQDSADPFDLNRFIEAQETDYALALSELRDGRKRSHWMWYIFPQFAGLGQSTMSQRYAIRSEEEARAYLDHPVLGTRLTECAEAVLKIEDRAATEIMGSPDGLKLRSCATLFAQVSRGESVFHKILDKYYSSEPDPDTLRHLNARN